jgi:hypothetical protein
MKHSAISRSDLDYMYDYNVHHVAIVDDGISIILSYFMALHALNLW